jgi:hypothetical protein
MRFDIGDVVREPADYVFLANVCHGVPDKSRLARAVHDVLRPGGSFAIVSWHAKPREQTTILEEPRGPATELRMPPEQTIASSSRAASRLEQIEVSPTILPLCLNGHVKPWL